MMSIFVHNDCFGYMVLDFLQQLKTSLKGVEMSGESKWEGGGGGGMPGVFQERFYTPSNT